jgi:anti-anti-sigma factor
MLEEEAVMNLEIETMGHTSIVRVMEEELRFPLLRTFFNSTSALIDSGTRDLVINLADVKTVDSASLGCLMDIFHNITKHHGTVTLVGMQERVESMVTMVGLTHRMEAVAEKEGVLATA